MDEAHSIKTDASPHPTRLSIWIVAAAVGLFLVRTSAPHNFLDKDQERPASYILDVVVNGHWICQTDWMGDVTSKPPMLTWMAAGLARLTGGVSPMILFLPSALAWTALAFLMFRWTRQYRGEATALFSALLLVLSPLGMRLFILLRTDALFGFMVGLTAACAWRAWNTGRGWTWFWLAAAAATLTKGPLGLVLGGLGLLAALRDRRMPPHRPPRYKEHVVGLALYLVLVLGWFAAAYGVMGEAVVDKMLRRELIAHAAHMENADPFWMRLLKPTIYFLHRMLPWSVLAVAGIVRRLRHPGDSPQTRRFDRFLLAWFGGGMALFSITQHQRGDLLAPILAPATVFAGGELAWWIERLRIRSLHGVAAVLTVLALVQSFYYYHRIEAASAPVRETQCIRAFTISQKRMGLDSKQGCFVDVPFTLQLYLGTMRRHVSPEAAASLLESDRAAWAAASPEKAQIIMDLLRAKGLSAYELARCESGVRTLFVLVGVQGRNPPLNLTAK